ncbi:hypothetical protein EDD15DRAFT_2202471 [Pisolithus albus]|nr:hypothetical protein EDD15DRAFT_2202471 [Pisolithus albus]
MVSLVDRYPARRTLSRTTVLRGNRWFKLRKNRVGHPQSIVATLHMRNLLLQRCHRHKILRLAHVGLARCTVHRIHLAYFLIHRTSVSTDKAPLRKSCVHLVRVDNRQRLEGVFFFLLANCDTQTTLYSDCSGRSSNNVLPSSTNYVPSDPPSGRCPSQAQVLPAEFLSHWRDPLVDTTELSSGRNRLSEKSLNFEECASSASSFNWGF